MSVTSSDAIRDQYSLVINLAQMFAETKAGIAAEALMQQKQRAKELQMNHHHPQRVAASVKQTHAIVISAENDREDEAEEKEEVHYMLMGKE